MLVSPSMSKTTSKKRQQKSKRVNVYLRGETLTKLDQMARQMCRSRSKQVEFLIESDGRLTA